MGGAARERNETVAIQIKIYLVPYES